MEVKSIQFNNVLRSLVEYYYSTETREVTGETFFSYKVLPPSDTYPTTISTSMASMSSMANMSSLTNNNSYVLPVETVETFPVDNFTIYDDFMQEATTYPEQDSKESHQSRVDKK